MEFRILNMQDAHFNKFFSQFERGTLKSYIVARWIGQNEPEINVNNMTSWV